MRVLEPEPWALGVRLRDEPDGARRLTIVPGSPADGRTIGELERLTDPARISLLVRDSALVPVTSQTRLQADDTIIVLAGSDGNLDKILRSVTEQADQC
jgi:cell volume regulation protein A